MKTEAMFEVFVPSGRGDGSYERPFRRAKVVRRTPKQVIQIFTESGQRWDQGKRVGKNHPLFWESVLDDFTWAMNHDPRNYAQ